ncbi:MAG: aldehyde dehydrogenase family protein [Ignavibacteriae bacterium]|nr:aldehyde dehydrogenase family protein [Ignavibacteriota bacterium]
MMLKQKFIMDHNPSTGEIIEKIKISSPGEVASCVKLARKASKSWFAVPLKNRIALLRKIEKDIFKTKDLIARTISVEMGKPLKHSIAEVETVLNTIDVNIKLSEEAFNTSIHKDKNLITEVQRIPMGVIAVITPWNYPVDIPISFIIPALLAGNCVVFKPSEFTPLSGKHIYEIFNRHFPKGVVNIIQGAEEVGDMILASDIDMIAFVGSRDTGKRIFAECAGRVIRMILELGGKDPMIVLKDADLKKAAEYAVFGALKNCGQICTSVERIYVEDKVAHQFEKLVYDEIRKVKIGDAFDKIDVGPLANEQQRGIVLRQIEEARRKGARILHGGNKVEGRGYFIEPALIVDVSEKHDLMTEETFGPIVAIQRVRNAEDAIEKANRTRFGLGATIWTKNLKKAKEIAAELEAGMIGINKGVSGVKGTPWVGIKESGFGYHGSIDGLKQFTHPKKVSYKN